MSALAAHTNQTSWFTLTDDPDMMCLAMDSVDDDPKVPAPNKNPLPKRGPVVTVISATLVLLYIYIAFLVTSGVQPLMRWPWKAISAPK